MDTPQTRRQMLMGSLAASVALYLPDFAEAEPEKKHGSYRPMFPPRLWRLEPDLHNTRKTLPECSFWAAPYSYAAAKQLSDTYGAYIHQTGIVSFSPLQYRYTLEFHGYDGGLLQTTWRESLTVTAVDPDERLQFYCEDADREIWKTARELCEDGQGCVITSEF